MPFHRGFVELIAAGSISITRSTEGSFSVLSLTINSCHYIRQSNTAHIPRKQEKSTNAGAASAGSHQPSHPRHGMNGGAEATKNPPPFLRRAH